MKVNEIFYSIQGEGILVGVPSIFLRLTGCNLRCSFCDTKYGYVQGKEMSVQAILDDIKKFACTYICLTGGEPLLQKDSVKLIENLLKKNYKICLETNGSISIKKLVGKKSLMISLDIKCPSSGSHEQMIMKNISYLSKKDQLKFIIKNKEDYDYAKKILKKYNPQCTVFFQPVWGTSAKKLASWILNDGLLVRLALQLHKIIWGEKRGV
ncbi:7-carboxy-7-deazaguanine synthase [uncultured archaeon]|nr:7-carboxy-7-deazaguanine synthase [uncultured archaeon]